MQAEGTAGLLRRGREKREAEIENRSTETPQHERLAPGDRSIRRQSRDCQTRSRRPCSRLSRENTLLPTRASEKRAKRIIQNAAARTYASRQLFLPLQNRTSIRCLRPFTAVTDD